MKIFFLILINIFILLGCSSSEENKSLDNKEQLLLFSSLLDKIVARSNNAITDGKVSEAENESVLVPALAALDIVESDNRFAKDYISVIKDSALFSSLDINKQSLHEKLIYVYHDHGTYVLNKYIEDASDYINAKNEFNDLNRQFSFQSKNDTEKQLRNDTKNQAGKDQTEIYNDMIDNVKLMADIIYDKKDEYQNDFIKTILNSHLFSGLESDYKDELRVSLDYLIHTHLPNIKSTNYLSCVDKKADDLSKSEANEDIISKNNIISGYFEDNKNKFKEVMKKIIEHGSIKYSNLSPREFKFWSNNFTDDEFNYVFKGLSDKLSIINKECNEVAFEKSLKIIDNHEDGSKLITSADSKNSDITFVYLDGNGTKDIYWNNWDIYIDCDPKNSEGKECENKLPLEFIESTTPNKELYLMTFIDTVQAILSANKSTEVEVLMGEDEREHLQQSESELWSERAWSAEGLVENVVDAVYIVSTLGSAAPVVIAKTSAKKASILAMKKATERGAKALIKSTGKSIRKYTAKELREVKDSILQNSRRMINGKPEYVDKFMKQYNRLCDGEVHHIIPVSVIEKAIKGASKLDKLFSKCGIYMSDSENYYNGASNGVCILPTSARGRPFKTNPNIIAFHQNHPSYDKAITTSLMKINPHSSKACDQITELTTCFTTALQKLTGEKVNSLTQPMKMWSKNATCPYY